MANVDHEIQNIEHFKTNEEILKKPQDFPDSTMTSSTVSSLSSPLDSGVQMLDSESELTSIMSNSGFGVDCETNLDCEKSFKKDEISEIQTKTDIVCEKVKKVDLEKPFEKENTAPFNGEKPTFKKHKDEPIIMDEVHKSYQNKERVMTISDIANQNVTDDFKLLVTHSVPSYFDKFDKAFESAMSSHNLDSETHSDEVFEMEHPIKGVENSDLMNVSLTSYELLDYTIQNRDLSIENTDMHVSLSEEVNENLKLALTNEPAAPKPEAIVESVPVVENKTEEQIVFRRQRRKKSKSDTPKKRVSFHEDILNSTKIDDIHINHGFITHEPDVSLSFFQRGFIRKPDVVKGRYSWAAEGDAPFYEKPASEREIKSDIYINNSQYSSTSSSSTASISSSIDEEDSDQNYDKKEPNLKSKPKSSCLKKTKHTKKYIDTNIVQEETNLRKKKSETNLLDSNIFGSLKNILNFSTSVPVAERGVPEGQEDFTIYSSSHDLTNTNKRKSFGSLMLKNFETIEIAPPAPISKMTVAKNNLKLTKSEGFYPNYPISQQNLPANIILCDSNVYEHKGMFWKFLIVHHIPTLLLITFYSHCYDILIVLTYYKCFLFDLLCVNFP